MKIKIIGLILFMYMSILSNAQNTIYNFTVNTIDGKEFKLEQLKGKKVMIVNVASKCGLTPQYTQLQEVYTKYASDTFTIIGFPANNFLSQEPGTNSEIMDFCSTKYKVTFPIMEKISVKGSDIHPLYKWLTSKEENGVMDADVSWNFQKFLINEKGELVKMVSPREKPDSKTIIDWIEGK